MKFLVHYVCLSHIGNVRSINQDNIVCDQRYIGDSEEELIFPLCGLIEPKQNLILGIFDGMGGEECGEIASYIAAKNAAAVKIGRDATDDLIKLCHKANNDICDYATLHEVSSMGTTAAMLAFTEKEVALCNIGDSKIFRLCNGTLEQISMDHVAVAAFGVKPPLSQNLGIPPNELVIDPYLARGSYNDGDIYLICSDGLTDMVSVEEITEVLVSNPINDAIIQLLEKALANGGRDNTTIILCKIERQSGWFFKLKSNTERKGV